DLLAVFYGEDLDVELTGTFSGNNNVSVIRDANGDGNAASLNQDDLVLLGNCTNVDLLRVTNTPSNSAASMTIEHAATGNVDANLSGVYTPESSLASVKQSAYYVKNTGRKTPDNHDGFALYRRDASGAEAELVEGIEFLRVLYGERLNTGAIRYRPAGSAGMNLSQIVSVRIGLLARSFDAVRDVA